MVWSALRAIARNVNESRKSLLNGKSSPENKCNSLTPDKWLRIAGRLSVRLTISIQRSWRRGKAEICTE